MPSRNVLMLQVGYLALRSESDALPEQLIALATDTAPGVRQVAHWLAGDWVDSNDR